MKAKDIQILIIYFYVDDLIYVGNSNLLIGDFRSNMIGEFEMIGLGLLAITLRAD